MFNTWNPNTDPTLPGPLLDASTPPKPIDMALFSEGGFLVSSPNGRILRIKEVDRVEETITLDRPPVDATFWFVPADTTTGRSPCIGVYSRAFPM